MHEYVSILHIDSRHAVRTSNVEFYVPFTGDNTFPGEVFREVVSVELHAIKFEGGAKTNEPYVVMDVSELNNNTFSNVPVANRTFAVIHTTHDTFEKTIKFDYQDKVRFFRPPLTSLNRLTFRFCHGDGTPVELDGFVTMILRLTHKNPI